ALLWAGLIPVWEGEAGTLVVPRHRTDPPALWRSDELRGDDTTRREFDAVEDAALVVGAEPMGNIAEYLGDIGDFGLIEAGQPSGCGLLVTRCDELVHF